jgi:hypothetical protein
MYIVSMLYAAQTGAFHLRSATEDCPEACARKLSPLRAVKTRAGTWAEIVLLPKPRPAVDPAKAAAEFVSVVSWSAFQFAPIGV